MQNTKNILVKYVLFVISGLLILVLCSILQNEPAPQQGEYYYSSFLRHNYTVLSGCLFFAFGIVIGYFFRLNTWLSGISLILVFRIVSFYEATVYRGSHNLIPFELIMHLLFALPAIAGVYIGKFIYKRGNIGRTI